MKKQPHELNEALSQTFRILDRVVKSYRPEPVVREVGTVTYVGSGVIGVTGLSGAQ